VGRLTSSPTTTGPGLEYASNTNNAWNFNANNGNQNANNKNNNFYGWAVRAGE
jgi:hypothetical protein